MRFRRAFFAPIVTLVNAGRGRKEREGTQKKKKGKGASGASASPRRNDSAILSLCDLQKLDGKRERERGGRIEGFAPSYPVPSVRARKKAGGKGKERSHERETSTCLPCVSVRFAGLLIFPRKKKKKERNWGKKKKEGNAHPDRWGEKTFPSP